MLRATPRFLIGGCIVGAATAGWLAASWGSAAKPAWEDSAERAGVIALAESAWTGEARLVGLTAPPRARLTLPGRSAAALARRLNGEVGRRRQPAQALAALAVIDLLDGRPEEAVKRLGTVAQWQPRNARVQSDLAAAYLRLAQSTGKSFYLLDAFAAADLARRLDSELPEALFNYALTIERLSLRGPAGRAWKKYLEMDANSAWSEVAKKHWFQLSRPTAADLWQNMRLELNDTADGGGRAVTTLVAISPQRSRLYAQEELLGEWGRSHLAGDREAAARTLEIARSIGEAVASRRGGDHTVKAAVESIDSASLTSPLRLRLAKGHADYASGIVEYNEGNPAIARSWFERSRPAFAAGGSPMQFWAAFDIARCDYRHARYGEALASLARLVAMPETSPYPSLVARAEWTRGLVTSIQGRFAETLTAYRHGLGLARGCGDSQSVAALHGLTANIFRLLAEREEASNHLTAALSGLPSMHEPIRIQAALEEAVLQALDYEMPRLALLFQTEALAAVRETVNAPAVAQAYHRRAAIYEQLGEFAAAWSDLESSRRWLARIDDDEARRVSEGDYVLAAARLRRRTAPRASIKLMNGALDASAATGYEQVLPALLLERARALRAIGDDQGAYKDLERAAEIADRLRVSAPAGKLRAGYLNEVEEIFDEMVRLLASREEGAAALDYLERGRARALLDLAFSPRLKRRGESATEALTASEVQRELPPGVTLVEYAVYEDLLLVWSVEKEQLELHSKAISDRELRGLVSELQRLVQQRSPLVDDAAEALYRVLISPVEHSLMEAQKVVFVPDGVLNEVPFALLRNPRSGRYIVRDRPWLVTPSASFYLLGLRRLKKWSRDDAPMTLIIGDPLFNASKWPWLRQLPGAEAEARQLAGHIPRAKLLVGAEATKQAFLQHFSRARYVHVASHAIVNREVPLQSGLVLARTADDPIGLLTLDELYSVTSGETAMVSLAGCSTLRGLERGNEGVLSLARPLLAAGVPVVLAALWPLPDSEVTPVVADFFQELLRGAEPSSALRSAQLAALARSTAPSADHAIWAGFELIGATD